MQRPWGRNMPGVRAETQPQGLERRAWGGPAVGLQPWVVEEFGMDLRRVPPV